MDEKSKELEFAMTANTDNWIAMGYRASSTTGPTETVIVINDKVEEDEAESEGETESEGGGGETDSEGEPASEDVVASEVAPPATSEETKNNGRRLMSMPKLYNEIISKLDFKKRSILQNGDDEKEPESEETESEEEVTVPEGEPASEDADSESESSGSGFCPQVNLNNLKFKEFINFE